jgi:hypothetical protein
VVVDAVRRRLNVLVVGSNRWALDAASATLEVAGHHVVRCTDPGEPEFPCNGLRPERGCPLDAGVDVVLVIRTQPGRKVAPGEFGVTCALRRDVPLVVAGRTLLHPFERWAIEPVDGAVAEVADDVARACERAARPQLV